MLILTPLGRGMGFLPTLDMLRSLPNLTEDFAAHAFFARGFPGHHAFGRGGNVDALSAQDTRNLFAADIHAATRTRDTLNARDHGQISGSVLEVQADKLLR